MERIKKPLHVASQERVTEVAGMPDFPDMRAPDSPGGGEVVAFEYSQTQIVHVPEAVLTANRVVTGRGQDAVTRAYKLLRTQVLQRLVKEDWQTMAVVSPSSGEGKTLTAINLAISLSNSRSHTALLVDLDWQQPSIHRYFGHQPEHDVCDYLRGELPLHSVLVNPGIPRFCWLPCARPVPDSSEHLAALAGFVRELKGRYRNRIVMFDVPPLLATDDALSFLPLVDCALLVVEESRTKAEDVQRCLELIGPDRLLGSVINKSRQSLARY